MKEYLYLFWTGSDDYLTADISEKFRPLPFREFKIKFENYHNSNKPVENKKEAIHR